MQEADQKIDTNFILDALEKEHPPEHYAFFRELRVGTGFGKDSEQRFDAYAIHYLKGKRNHARCFEIKASRGDFISEVKKPLKRKAGLRLSHEFYFVAPQGMLKITEIPPECGLIEVKADGTLHYAITAPFRDTWPATWQFIASICRRLDVARRKEAEIEARIKNLVYEREVITRSVLFHHIKKWQSHNIGSREVPDLILAALLDLQRDVEEGVTNNRSVK